MKKSCMELIQDMKKYVKKINIFNAIIKYKLEDISNELENNLMEIAQYLDECEQKDSEMETKPKFVIFPNPNKLSKEKVKIDTNDENMANRFLWNDVENAMKGKTISSILNCGDGIVIHFTDGTEFTNLNGVIYYDGTIDKTLEDTTNMEFDSLEDENVKDVPKKRPNNVVTLSRIIPKSALDDMEIYPISVDSEDKEFTGEDYYSCGNCGKFFGHFSDIPEDKVCPKCHKKIML